MTAGIVVALIWKYILHPSYGLANAMLNTVGLSSLPWLVQAKTAMPSLVMISSVSVNTSLNSPMTASFLITLHSSYYQVIMAGINRHRVQCLFSRDRKAGKPPAFTRHAYLVPASQIACSDSIVRHFCLSNFLNRWLFLNLGEYYCLVHT